MRLERWGQRPGPRPLRVAVMGKGGASKTTSTASLGDALERLTGWPVVLVDLDAQPSLSRWLAPRGADHLRDDTLVEVLAGEAPTGDVVVPLREPVDHVGGLYLLPAHDGLAELTGEQLSVDALADVVDHVVPAGVVLIDTPPAQPVTSSSLLLVTALAAADVVVIPFALGVKAVDAMRMVLADVQAVRPGVPVLLLPANVDGALHVGAGVAVAAALRPDLRLGAAVPHDARHLVRDAEDAGRLLADHGRSSNPTVRAYATAAEQLAELLLEVAAGVQA